MSCSTPCHSAVLALTAALAASGCRSSCEPRIVADDPATEARIAAYVDLFFDQVGSEYEVCVPKVEQVASLEKEQTGQFEPGGIYYPGRRHILLKRVDLDTALHEFCHALDYQNDLSTPRDTWAIGVMREVEPSLEGFDAAREGFATACSRAVAYAPLLRSSCPTDGPRVALDQLALDFMDSRDYGPGPDFPGVVDLPAAFTVRIRAAGAKPWDLRTNGEVLNVGDSAEPGGGWYAESERPNLEGPFVKLENADLSDGTGLETFRPWTDLPDENLIRRVWIEDGVMRVLGDGCVHDDERMFEWQGRAWSAWTEDLYLVAGTWDL